MAMDFWHEWRGSIDGRPSMLIRHIFSFRGYRLDLHKFIRADDPECFHTHPAKAIRLILWGGYIEERRHEDYLGIINGRIWMEFEEWTPLCLGNIYPDTCHRIARILNGKASYSLWFRWPKSAEVTIYGKC